MVTIEKFLCIIISFYAGCVSLYIKGRGGGKCGLDRKLTPACLGAKCVL